MRRMNQNPTRIEKPIPKHALSPAITRSPTNLPQRPKWRCLPSCRKSHPCLLQTCRFAVRGGEGEREKGHGGSEQVGPAIDVGDGGAKVVSRSEQKGPARGVEDGGRGKEVSPGGQGGSARNIVPPRTEEVLRTEQGGSAKGVEDGGTRLGSGSMQGGPAKRFADEGVQAGLDTEQGSCHGKAMDEGDIPCNRELHHGVFYAVFTGDHPGIYSEAEYVAEVSGPHALCKKYYTSEEATAAYEGFQLGTHSSIGQQKESPN